MIVSMKKICIIWMSKALMPEKEICADMEFVEMELVERQQSGRLVKSKHGVNVKAIMCGG